MIRDPSDGSTKPEIGIPRSGLESLRAKYGPNWGLKIDKRERKPKPAPTAEELRQHYATHNLGFKPKESE